MDARSVGVGLLGAILIFAAGCSGSGPAAEDPQGSSAGTDHAGADRTESATESEGGPAAEAQEEEEDEEDGDYSAISGTWTGDLIWVPEGVDPSSGSPYHAELQLELEADPHSPVGRLVERRRHDSGVICTWTVFAVRASAPTYEVAAREGSPAAECDSGSMELEWDEESDRLVVDGRWPKGSWDGELTREAGS